MGITGGRRARWLVAGLVVAVSGASVSAYALTRDGPATAGTPPVGAVDRGSVTVEIAATGTAVPAQTRSLGFAASGTVVRVTVQPGDTVTAGKELAAIDDDDAEERVTQAEDDLADAKDALAKAREAADDGQSSCTTSGVRPASLTLAAAPTATPSPARTTTPERTTAPTARPSATASRSAGGSGQQGGGATGGTPSDGSQDGACDAKAGGDQILSAEQRVNSARQQAEEATEGLSGTVVTAPFAGKVLSVAGKVGSTVSAGGAFIELADVNGMQVSAQFPEADAGRLEVRQKAVVTLPAQPDEQFGATVAQVDPVGTTSGSMVTYGTLLAFTNAPTGMLVGQSANVRVTTATVTGVLRVPATAVHEIQDSSGVVRVRSGTGSQRRPVRIGLRGDQHIEITSGLTEGEEVLTGW